MRLQIPFTLSNSATLQEIIRFASISISKIQTIVNGNVDLIDNGANQILSFSFSKAGFDVGVAHSLGTVPRGYIQIGSSNTALTLANGATPNSTSTLYLQAGSTGTATVMVF